MTRTQNIIGVKELRQNLEKYISQVNKGIVFTVVKKSKPVFKMSPVDEWGDSGVWKTVIDFREINKQGVLATDVLETLEKLNGQD